MNDVKRPVDPAVLHYIENEVRVVGRVIDAGLNPDRSAKKYGFAILLFSFDGPEFTWLSNAERVDMVNALEEMLLKFKQGRQDELHNIGH